MFTLQMFSGQIAELIKDGEIQGFQVNTKPPKTFFLILLGPGVSANY